MRTTSTQDVDLSRHTGAWAVLDGKSTTRLRATLSNAFVASEEGVFLVFWDKANGGC
jgi:hypothetical protein